jgi:glucose-1-phosphate thymidylyltransferase
VTVALLPAAGAAARVGGGPKELVPVVLEPAAGGLVPVPALAHAVGTCARAGIDRAVIVVSPARLESVRWLGDGAALGVAVAWVVQPEPLGLTDAVLRGLAWTGGERVALVLPDTLHAPADALARVLAEGGDVTLGVFPTDHPEELGPVAIGDGRVTAVLEKPTGPCPANTWGLMALSPRFQAWLADRVARSPDLGRVSIGLHADAALRAGLDVRAVVFPDGRYRDLGTPRSLADWVAE